MVVGTSIILPEVRAWNYDGGTVFFGRLGNGGDATDEHGSVRVSNMIVNLISMQPLLLASRINLESHGAG